MRKILILRGSASRTRSTLRRRDDQTAIRSRRLVWRPDLSSPTAASTSKPSTLVLYPPLTLVI